MYMKYFSEQGEKNHDKNSKNKRIRITSKFGFKFKDTKFVKLK
jgi:hypothetical protein